MPVSVSMQPLLLWHSSLCAATYACCLSGKRGDFVSMAQHLTLCLVMLALLIVVPQTQQSTSINAISGGAEPAGKRVKRGSGASGLDTPARLVRQKSGACEGTCQGDNRPSTSQQVSPSPFSGGRRRGRLENALLPGCVPKEGKSGSPVSADQHMSGVSGASSRDGSRSLVPACRVGVDSTTNEGPTALRRASSKNGNLSKIGTREAHAATADRLQSSAQAKRRAEQDGSDGTDCKVPRLLKGQTVRCLMECAARCWSLSVKLKHIANQKSWVPFEITTLLSVHICVRSTTWYCAPVHTFGAASSSATKITL
jgi:hypothetical protein